MNKKIVFLSAVIIILIGFGIYMISNKSNNKTTNNISSKSHDDINNKEENNKKVAVIFFSVTGTTRNVAQKISNIIGGELIEIEPKEKYTSTDLNWNDSKSRTSIECNDPTSRPEIENSINVDYDVIYLGYPIWWGDVPHIILTFMDNYKLDGKTVIPFCTSGETDINKSMVTLKKYNKNVNWIDGKRLSSSESEIKRWINSLNY